MLHKIAPGRLSAALRQGRGHLYSILIKANNAKDIVHKVTYLIKRPKQIERMGKNALITASKYSWPKYQNKLVEIINDNL